MKNFKKFQYSGKCVDISSDGKGIIKDGDKVIFVSGLFLNEVATVEVDYQRAGVYFAHILKLDKISEDRIQPKCKVCSACGGCQFQQLNYNAQLEYKTKKVQESLKRIGGIAHEVLPCVGMDEPYFYRNKIQMPIGLDKRKNIVSGFYKEKSHEIIPIEKCFIEDERASKIITSIKMLMPSFKLRPYDEDRGIGEVRHILVRTSKHYEQIMVVLVMNCDSFTGRNNFVKALIKECPEITTVVQNINKRHTNVILGEKEEVLYGPGFIKDKLCDLEFKISAKSFYQINPVQCEKLYKIAINFADLTKKDVVLDAYAGVGTIGICAAKYAKKVYSVELVKEASRDGFDNAKRNSVENVQFICEDATQYIQKCVINKTQIDIVLMDPPRSGSTPEFINSVLELLPRKVVYVSCDPTTLARDLKLFMSKYNVEKVQPVDMFPQTFHVETIVELYLKNNSL